MASMSHPHSLMLECRTSVSDNTCHLKIDWLLTL